MILSESAEKKLKSWLGPETWHTRHDLDMNRWYEFVDQYQKDHGFSIDEEALKDHIAKIAGCSENEELIDVISQRISLAYNILDFLKRTHR